VIRKDSGDGAGARPLLERVVAVISHSPSIIQGTRSWLRTIVPARSSGLGRAYFEVGQYAKSREMFQESLTRVQRGELEAQAQRVPKAQ